MFWTSLLLLLLLLGFLLTVGYLRLSLKMLTGFLVVWLLLVPIVDVLHHWMWIPWLLVLVQVLLLNWTALRLRLITRPFMRMIKKNRPHISRTEQEALESGTTWWDAELFSGKPRWHNLRDLSPHKLKEEEHAFIEGNVNQLCALLNDWEITHEQQDLPPEVWDFIKQQGFFGMIIPKRYGGLEFSAQAHSDVVMKIASRSITAAVTVMVPNSLGPGQLLLRYGTEAQKAHYLPRLARGEEIPCFALTGPEAGSDAGSIPDVGIVCRQDFEDKENVLGIRLNWEKRYITLGPVATLLGLAFHLYDPDHLLGAEKDLGITVALIPTDTAGVEIGARHMPLNITFQNGPNWGHDVFIPMHWVLGGQTQIGKGWRMLVACLGEGRGISLPALATGAAKLSSRITGAYARVRKQFGLPIGYFEGIEQPLARILGNTYIMDAGRRLTATALDNGQHPAIITALLKYQLTERMRIVINDAMDIQGGSGICLGPLNYIGRAYQAVPIAITVEGANILTRSLIVFGQGAIRCHPYLLAEINAVKENNEQRFDRLLLDHALFFSSNIARSVWFGFSNAVFEVPGTPATRAYYRSLTRLSAGFALLSDYALLTLGGRLKRRERLSGRFADILANLYLCSAVLKHFEDQGEPKADLPLLNYACTLTIHQAQQAMLAAFHNLPYPLLAKTLRGFLFPWGKPYAPPSDDLIHQVAALALKASATRDRLTAGICQNDDPTDATGRIEYAFQQTLQCAELERKFAKLLKNGELESLTRLEQLAEAERKNVITKAQRKQLETSYLAMREAVKVDFFEKDQL